MGDPKEAHGFGLCSCYRTDQSLETLAREWLRSIDAAHDFRTSLPILSVASLAALLRSRDERALRIVEEVRAQTTNQCGCYGWRSACNEIKRGLTLRSPSNADEVLAKADDLLRRSRLEEVAGDDSV
jgi:hypothetical protein